MAEQQKKLQDLTDEFQKLQSELQSVVDGRQKLESQQQENKGVQQEFEKIADDANIYKLVGPVLLKQDKSEAVLAVSGRLEFIEKEIKRIEGQISEIQERSEKKKIEIITLQTEMQQLQQPAAA
ncbi:putative prefoldin subunit 6 protein [Lasiodiplodia theobromae]|uniref:Prefoldin subunit 6 n=1 Tax=Lasiodiplodia theobromae TaxID=45133 RepID=A0A5N5CYM2_9PEZI|nr:Prefoldin subunit 6 [Lasiodiplodia theobromae]KAB2570382.1 Prefoldin subunit 6 [Lasiodiplodia theobromae]KAF4536981.1 Prefoldin subunit 6 [Lasiodiplodia theobromae]KAF9636064.1 putative prefoldin subunit 6 protein [Lasiodiplodia theobromae]